MIQIKRLLLTIIISACIAMEAFGGGQNRAGTNSAPELMIPVGSRYLAMGSSNVATVAGLEAIYWNPAGVDLSTSNANALFSYRNYFADMSMSYVAVSGRLGEIGSIGLAFRSLNIGQINVTTLAQPDGTGEILSPSYFVMGLTYSKQLTDRISIGVNANLISESWGRVNATGFGFDAGVEYNGLLEVPNLALGVVVKNLGASMKYGGNGTWVLANDPQSDRGPTYLQIGTQSSELPSQISLGLSYSRSINEENKLMVAGAFVNNNYTYDNYNFGLEYSYKDLLYLRGGYMYAPQATSDNPSIYQGFAAGVGLNLSSVTGMDLSVDYAYIPVKYFSADNSFTLKVGF